MKWLKNACGAASLVLLDSSDFSRSKAIAEIALLADAAQRGRFALEYRKTQALYYQGQPDFDVMVARTHQYIDTM